jgi:hypothetical protein
MCAAECVESDGTGWSRVFFAGLRVRLGRSKITRKPASAWEYSVQPYCVESCDL